MNESTLKWTAVALLCTTIIAGAAALYYMNQLNSLKADYDATISDLDEFTILVDIMIDYGNETQAWYNNTRLAMGTDLMRATDIISDIDITESEWGAFLNAINGVGEDPNKWWLWYYYDEGWQSGQVGARQRILHEGDIVSWSYSSGE